MHIRTEVNAALAGLLALQLLTAAGAIGLLGRTGPAIEQILEENAASIRAVEQMQRALASPDPGARQAQFEAALGRAQRNLTEEAERGPLDEIERRASRAMGGDPRAREAALEALEALARINHDRMAQAEGEARRLSRAGAWAAVVLGLISFMIGVLVSRWLARRVLAPLDELASVAAAHEAGDPYRRATVRGASEEIVGVGQTLNQLLDERTQDTIDRGWERDEELPHQRALSGMIDQLDRPAVILYQGRVLSANQPALEVLSDDDGAWRQAMREALEGDDEDRGRAHWLELDEELWLAQLPEGQGPTPRAREQE